MRKRIAIRSIGMGAFFTVLFLLLLGRVFWIQTVNAEWLNARAQKMWEGEYHVDPRRGTIFDRNGEPLAYDGPSYNVVAVLSKKDPHHIINPIETAQKLSPILEMSTEKILQLLSKDRYQIELRPGGWKISQEKADQIQELDLPGILLQKNTKRYYPNQFFASHTLGYVDKEGEAKMGLELYYDEQLRGIPGKYRIIKDAKNVVLPTGLEDFHPAKDGYNLVLTLDQRIQHYVEKALDDAEATFQPKGMTVIVADPNTMEILAISSRPHFNPNEYSKGITNYYNSGISSTFEPGSTFKIVTLAAAVEEGLFNPDETYTSGRYSDQNITPPIRDHNNGQGWGNITFLEGVQRSSNVAFVTLGYERLGKEKLFKYYHEFGFGQKTMIDLPNESEGKLPNAYNAYPRDVAASTFGQGPVTVTAIQQVAAVAAIANGGNLLQPYLVKEIIDSKTNEVVQQFEPTVVRQVIRPKTAKEVSEILESVVTSPVGTGRNYAIEEYRVAGKTGTAQKVGPNGKYLENKYLYSFIGYAPVEDPKLIIYVVIEEPSINVISGSTMIAPIFKSVMKNSLQYLQVHPQQNLIQEENESKQIKMPDLLKEHYQVANQKAINLGLNPEVFGEGNRVVRQHPAPGTLLEIDTRIYLLTEESQIQLPDFKNKSLREALEFTSFIGMEIQTQGTGYIVEQSIPPGTIVKNGTTLQIRLEPLNPLVEKGMEVLPDLAEDREQQLTEDTAEKTEDNSLTKSTEEEEIQGSKPPTSHHSGSLD